MSEFARLLPIGEVAERAGMSASRIRYYEARGLLPDPQRAAGKRRYSEDVFRRLAIIDGQITNLLEREADSLRGRVTSPRTSGCASSHSPCCPSSMT